MNSNRNVFIIGNIARGAVALALLSLWPAIGVATDLTVNSLNVGSSVNVNLLEPNVVASSSNGAAIGKANTVSDPYTWGGGSLAIGWGNHLSGVTLAFGESNSDSNDSWYNSLFGGSNCIYNGYCSSLFGYGNNMVSSVACTIFGILNNLDLANGVPSDGSILVGISNNADSITGCLVSGQNNIAEEAENSAAIGNGLILNTSSSSRVIVGQYNRGDETDEIFVVATGTGPGPTDTRNAFVVKSNGDIVMAKAQGDVLMGEFQ